MPFASFWIFPDDLRKKNKVVIRTHPKIAIVKVIVFGLQAKYFSKKELHKIIDGVELDG